MRQRASQAVLMRGLCAFFAFFVPASIAAQPAPDLSNAYQLDARFDPATGQLAVQGTMEVAADQRKESLKLLLNDALKVQSFTHNGREARVEPTYVLDGQTVPGAQAIVVPLSSPLDQGQRTQLSFRYEGRLTTDQIYVGRGVVSSGWTELTLEAFWYPILFEEPLIRSELILRVPERYQVVGPGGVERLGPGRWRLDPRTIVSGRITFALSDSWRVEERALAPGLKAALHTIRPEPRSAEILGAVGSAHAYFTRLFGPPRSGKGRITLLLANAEIGLKYPNQAFATAGDFIVMSNGDAQGQIDTLHHEVAHLWWSKGQPGTPHEFLSESVSEYLALRQGEATWGSDWLARRRASMAKRSAEIQGSILKLDGVGSGPRQPLLYDRGPNALWLLHDWIGSAAMDALLQEAYSREVSRLPEFLDLVGQRHGPATQAWFRALL